MSLVAAVFAFLALALLLYVLLAGADFGAGILEVFLSKAERPEHRKIISKAMAPVWEANHIWLILAVVIIFVGFPALYQYLSVYLHIPMMAVLMGIVARGCAFTFRHYDEYTADYHNLYSRIFAYSSLWTAVFLGVIAGALILGKINPQAIDFHSLYLAPWLNSFCLSLGLFTACLFSFLAAIYLTGEAPELTLQSSFRKKAGIANIALLPLGALVFITAEVNGLALIKPFFRSGYSVAAWFLATLLLYPFWRRLRAKATVKNTIEVRGLGAAIVVLILLAWYWLQYPVALRFIQGGELVELTFQQIAAPHESLRTLLWALGAGVIIIFPALLYLLRIFKWESLEEKSG